MCKDVKINIQFWHLNLQKAVWLQFYKWMKPDLLITEKTEI